MLSKCVYCGKFATTQDAIGLDCCKEHSGSADKYFEQKTGRKPNQDTFIYCKQHGDMWEPGCPRCEECSQYHYGHDVARLIERTETGELGIKLYKA